MLNVHLNSDFDKVETIQDSEDQSATTVTKRETVTVQTMKRFTEFEDTVDFLYNLITDWRYKHRTLEELYNEECDYINNSDYSISEVKSFSMMVYDDNKFKEVMNEVVMKIAENHRSETYELLMNWIEEVPQVMKHLDYSNPRYIIKSVLTEYYVTSDYLFNRFESGDYINDTQFNEVKHIVNNLPETLSNEYPNTYKNDVTEEIEKILKNVEWDMLNRDDTNTKSILKYINYKFERDSVTVSVNSEYNSDEERFVQTEIFVRLGQNPSVLSRIIVEDEDTIRYC